MGRNTRLARALLATMAAATMAGLAACGTGTTSTAPPSASSASHASTSMPPSMSMPASASSTTASAPVASNSVTIKGFAFSPSAITVKVGTTVTWTNQDQDAHTVTATGGAFGSQALDTGSHYSFTFTKAGTYDYLCTIHPFMTATVVVTP